MDNLFVLYRYLVQSQSPTDDTNSYNITLHTLENLLEMIRELDHAADMVRAHGGFDFAWAERISDRLIESHEGALLNHYKGAKETVIRLVERYLRLEDFDDVIARIGQRRDVEERNQQELGEIDEHPF